MKDKLYQGVILFLVVFVATVFVLALNGCGTEEAVAAPLSQRANTPTQVQGVFTYTHTGCPVDLLVWEWVDGIAQPPRAFLNLAESLRLSLDGERVTWRLRVDNESPLGFTVDGSGDCTLTQPGCF